MINSFRADIHCHSICSDGSDAPRELLYLAKKIGLQGLSITDHDTLDAYTPDLFAEAKKLEIRLLTGIEISSEQDNIPVHVLGYGYDLNYAPLKEFLVLMQKRRKDRNQTILEKLAARKMVISEDELNTFASDRTVGRPHIAQIMLAKGYVGSIKEAFDVYLNEKGLCYAPGIKYLPGEVIGQIHAAKGKAVLAHPHFYHKSSFVRKLLALSFDGIECHYPKLAKAQEQPWLKIAKERNLIPTGGSDYHGKIKPQIPLGCSWVNQEIFDLLEQSK